MWLFLNRIRFTVVSEPPEEEEQERECEDVGVAFLRIPEILETRRDLTEASLSGQHAHKHMHTHAHTHAHAHTHTHTHTHTLWGDIDVKTTTEIRSNVCERAWLFRCACYVQIVFHSWLEAACARLSVTVDVRSHTCAVTASDATRPEVDLRRAHDSAARTRRVVLYHFWQRQLKKEENLCKCGAEKWVFPSVAMYREK